jgi:flagellar protein FlbD
MIQLTRLNRVPIILNSDLIEHIEVTPDTVITLTNGQRYMVLESAGEVVEKVISFRRAIVKSGGCAVLEDSSPQLVVREPETRELEINEALKAHGR